MTSGRTFVAGGSGLVGVNLVARLHRDGHGVSANWHSREPAQLRDCYVQADLTDFSRTLEVTRGCDTMVITAGWSGGIGSSHSKPTADIGPNVTINYNLLEAARLHGMRRVVVLGSGTVYHDSPTPLREEDYDPRREPHVAYVFVGRFNRFVEELCEAYRRKFGMSIATLRPSNIYGPHDHFEPPRSHVLPALIRQTLAGESPLIVWGGPHIVRDYVFVDDVIDAVLRILNDAELSGPLNVSGVAARLDEVVPKILQACGRDVAVTYDATKPVGVLHREFDSTKYRTRYPAATVTPLAEGLQRTVEWYRRHQGLSN